MSAPRLEPLQTRIETVIALSRLFERVESSGVKIGADQYQALVRQLKTALSSPLPEPALQAILGAHPASAEIYENMHYDVSGLSRSSLERSVATEMLATQALDRAARSSRNGGAPEGPAAPIA
ncbi:MAG: hypothetical protein ACXWIZ_04550 [Caldimonas sp.]